MENKFIEADIHLYIPFKTENYYDFRKKLFSAEDWQYETAADSSFYLKYINRIFNKNGIFSDCMITKKSLHTELGSNLFINEARIFSFDTGAAFLELSIPFSCDTFEELENTVSLLRLSNQKLFSDKDKKEISINETSLELLSSLGTKSIFCHLPENAQTRPELFVSVILDDFSDNLDLHAYRIANGLDERYKGEAENCEFYSNFPHIKWAITDRGICNIGIKTKDAANREFIENNWFNFTKTRYIFWYMLILNQKYTLYQYMNDIAENSSFGNLRDFRKKIMEFNTKYRFSIISEEASYQKLYEIAGNIKGLQREFDDIDEEIERIADYHESKNDKNTSKAMTIISILCAVSAIKDFYEFLTRDSLFSNAAYAFNVLSPSSKLIFVLFMIIIAAALIIVIPKSGIINLFRKISRKFRNSKYKMKGL